MDIVRDNMNCLDRTKRISSYYGPTIINDVIGNNICLQDEFFKIEVFRTTTFSLIFPTIFRSPTLSFHCSFIHATLFPSF